MLQDARYYEAVKLIEFNRHEEAQVLLDEVIQAYPEHWEAFNKKGVIAVKEGRAEEAESFFRRALAISQDYAPALANMGNLYFERGDLDAARELYLEAIEADVDYYMSYYNLALTYKRQGDYKKYVSNMKTYKRLLRRARPSEDEQFRLQYKKKMGCLPTMVVSLLAVMMLMIALL